MDLNKLEAALQHVLEGWHKAKSLTSPLAELYLFQQTLRKAENNPHQIANDILHKLIKILEKTEPHQAELLTRRYLDGEPVQKISHSLNLSESTFHRHRQTALEQLALILATAESEAQKQHQARLEQRLDRPTYTHLIGVEARLHQLLAVLTPPQEPWLIAIEGLGGLGKTSLAQEIVRRIIHHNLFMDVGWVSAQSHFFELSGQITSLDHPALKAENLIERLVTQLLPEVPKTETFSYQAAKNLLKRRLAQIPHLIVIDNLETVSDLEELLPTLRELANPTKFLLTSRERLYHEVAIHHFLLPELNETDAIHLIRHEIKQHNLVNLAQASDDELGKIYQVVGGNPLAIRLVVGQTHVFTLDDILDDLNQIHSQTVEDLYTYIYQRAWRLLDQPSRTLLLTMPLLTETGETFLNIVTLSGLAAAEVRTALNTLVVLNLVNSIGDHTRRHYSIHNLTRTFLQEQILKWQ